jgi:2-polyprenyl-3-methyl-5-hydroxy-6-metoxy-1,4-benzoquinol methylase
MTEDMTERYVHGYAAEERERLVAQAEHWRDDLILPGTKLRSGMRLLEVGCGVGAVLGILGTAFPGVELAGVDYEERQIEAARTHLSRLGFQADLRRADAVDLPWGDGSFEHVWMMWLLEHVADPVAALREARRVLVPDGELTAIEVDYNSVWASPSSDALEALFALVAGAMDANGRSDAGARLEGWLVDAGYASVDPGERGLAYSGDDLVRQIPYVAAVVESTLATLLDAGDVPTAVETGLDEMRALPDTPDAALGWVVHKAHARATSSR